MTNWNKYRPQKPVTISANATNKTYTNQTVKTHNLPTTLPPNEKDFRYLLRGRLCWAVCGPNDPNNSGSWIVFVAGPTTNGAWGTEFDLVQVWKFDSHFNAPPAPEFFVPQAAPPDGFIIHSNGAYMLLQAARDAWKSFVDNGWTPFAGDIHA